MYVKLPDSFKVYVPSPDVASIDADSQSQPSTVDCSQSEISAAESCQSAMKLGQGTAQPHAESTNIGVKGLNDVGGTMADEMKREGLEGRKQGGVDVPPGVKQLRGSASLLKYNRRRRRHLPPKPPAVIPTPSLIDALLPLNLCITNQAAENCSRSCGSSLNG